MTGAEQLAAELLAGPWRAEPLVLRTARAAGKLLPGHAIRRLVGDLLARWPVRPGVAELTGFLRDQPELTDEPFELPPVDEAYQPPRLHRPITPVSTPDRLATLLSVTTDELRWLADVQLRTTRLPPGPLPHYRYRWLAGSGKVRLLQIPKPRLKEAQRRLARHVLNRVPLHDAAHGGVRARSVRTCLLPHAGRAVVLRCDIEGFFTAITAPRVRGLYSAIGLDEAAAALAAGLSTAAVGPHVRRQLPRPLDGSDVFAYRRELFRLAVPHLPQGAPSSPGIANAICYSLDYRLAALAGANAARYTRYVDDLIFSVPPGRTVGALLAGVRDIVGAEGFRLAERKTALLRSSGRQALLGSVVNDSVSIERGRLDRLKAILHNCARTGPAAQCGDHPVEEFRAQLQGQIGWVRSVNPAKGLRLQQSFDRIDWDDR